MGRRNRRGRPRSSTKRRERALEASKQLSKILASPWEYSNQLAQAAAMDLWRLSRRHQIGIPGGDRTKVCRTCQSSLRPGVTSRVRIRSGQKITTCLQCNRVYRKTPTLSTEGV